MCVKVFDLQCAGGHAFEGWFSSEGDYQDQLDRGLLTCPLCSATDVARVPSAPRLNLRRQTAPARTKQKGDEQPPAEADVRPGPPAALQATWLKALRRIVAQTEDVGQQFPEEARRMHYGETRERGIRGQATAQQTRELLEEGISVMPLPDGFKDTLQ